MSKVTVLNFDHALRPQSYWQQPAVEWIDLTDLDRTNGYCAMESLEMIRRRLQGRKNRGVTLIGRGSYHYVSYVLISEIKRPFTLLLFDHHPDMMEAPGLDHISCGSWVLQALQDLPNLRKVILIGTADRWAEEIPLSFRNRVKVYPESVLQEGLDGCELAEEIPTDLVYISVDKDVLARSEAVTDWDQGSMAVQQVIDLCETATEGHQVVGGDLCGEQPVSPVLACQPASRQGILLNERANRRIAKAILHRMKQQSASKVS